MTLAADTTHCVSPFYIKYLEQVVDLMYNRGEQAKGGMTLLFQTLIYIYWATLGTSEHIYYLPREDLLFTL